MNRKVPATILVIIMLSSISFFLLNSYVSDASSFPQLSIVLSGTTSTSVIPAQAVGTTFNVDVRVDSTGSISPGINAYSYAVTWNAALLSCTNLVDPGPFLPSGDPGKVTSFTGAPDNKNGILVVGDIIIDSAHSAAAATGSGVLSTLTFTVLAAGGCNITIVPSDVGVAYLSYPDAEGNSHDVIGTTTVNAQYNESPSSSLSPSPSASPSPSPSPSGSSKQPSITYILVGPNLTPVGSPISCTANVSGLSPTGTITWSSNSSTGKFTPNPTSLVSGISVTSYTDTTPGTIIIIATYSGDENNAPSSNSVNVTYCAPINFISSSTIGFPDIVYFVSNYNYFHQGLPFDPACDLNHDGKIDFTDVKLFVTAYDTYWATTA